MQAYVKAISPLYVSSGKAEKSGGKGGERGGVSYLAFRNLLCVKYGPEQRSRKKTRKRLWAGCTSTSTRGPSQSPLLARSGAGVLIGEHRSGRHWGEGLGQWDYTLPPLAETGLATRCDTQYATRDLGSTIPEPRAAHLSIDSRTLLALPPARTSKRESKPKVQVQRREGYRWFTSTRECQHPPSWQLGG